MPTVPFTIGEGSKKTFGLLSFLDASEREEYEARWNEVLSSFKKSMHSKPRRWGVLKHRRRIKREIKREIRSGKVNHIEVECDDVLQTSREKRRLKNLLGLPVCLKINFA